MVATATGQSKVCRPRQSCSNKLLSSNPTPLKTGIKLLYFAEKDCIRLLAKAGDWFSILPKCKQPTFLHETFQGLGHFPLSSVECYTHTPSSTLHISYDDYGNFRSFSSELLAHMYQTLGQYPCLHIQCWWRRLQQQSFNIMMIQRINLSFLLPNSNSSSMWRGDHWDIDVCPHGCRASSKSTPSRTKALIEIPLPKGEDKNVSQSSNLFFSCTSFWAMHKDVTSAPKNEMVAVWQIWTSAFAMIFEKYIFVTPL